MWAPACIPPTPSPAASRETSPVFLLDVDGLVTPAIPTRAPVFAWSGPSERSAGAVEVFTVTLAGDADRMQGRVVDRETGNVTELIRLPDATDAGAPTVQTGNARFRRLHSSADGSNVYEVMIPGASAPVRLEFFARTLPDGSALQPAVLTVVRDFYYIGIIGDSVMWGLGLEESHKFTFLVARQIESRDGTAVIQQRFAQNGAEIVPAAGDGVCGLGCNGELPSVTTSIRLQAELLERPELLDLVVVNGCINDVGVSRILDPEMTGEELAELTERFCQVEMAALLRRVRERAPQARILVTGYYPIVGPESDIPGISVLASVQDVPTPTDANMEGAVSELSPTDFIDVLVEQSRVFFEASTANLRAAVDAVAAETDGRIAYVDAGFQPENAVMASDPWLWGLTRDNERFDDLAPSEIAFELFPEDNTQELRVDLCLAPDFPSPSLLCLYVSVGHPNNRGAAAYAEAMLEQLDALGSDD